MSVSGHFGAFVVQFGALWRHFGALWGFFYALRGHFGTHWGLFGLLRWGHFGTLWGHIGHQIGRNIIPRRVGTTMTATTAQELTQAIMARSSSRPGT